MWELIAANRRRSIILFSLMGIVLLLLGSIIGYHVFDYTSWYWGTAIAFLCWAVLAGLSFFQGDRLILSMVKANKANPNHYPMLYNVVDEMRIASGLPYRPHVFVIPEKAPNAFATGKNSKSGSIVVTTGLITILNRDELQGVIAHETAHLLNRDIVFMTHASIMLGSIVFLSDVFLRSFLYSGGRFGKVRRKAMNRGIVFVYLASLIFAVLSPLIAQVLYYAISRKREFLADATAARLTRYPTGLASALHKISISTYSIAKENQTVTKAIAPFYIVNPFQNQMRLINFNTHPPLEKRIAILNKLRHSVNYLTYQKVYSSVCGEKGKSSNILPRSALNELSLVAVRVAEVIENQKTNENIIDIHRENEDRIKAEENYRFLQCTCGMKIKVPEEFNKTHIQCPKCKKTVFIPSNESTSDSLNNEKDFSDVQKRTDENGKVEFIYNRKGESWETFSCICGSAKQISPCFKGNHIFCTQCERDIKIINSVEDGKLENER